MFKKSGVNRLEIQYQKVFKINYDFPPANVAIDWSVPIYNSVQSIHVIKYMTCEWFNLLNGSSLSNIYDKLLFIFGNKLKRNFSKWDFN